MYSTQKVNQFQNCCPPLDTDFPSIIAGPSIWDSIRFCLWNIRLHPYSRWVHQSGSWKEKWR